MPRLLIHGGAGTIRDEDRAAYEAGLAAARDAGRRVLAAGGSAVEAVLAAVSVMEDDPEAFNAGTGGAPNRDGVVECDAAVMTCDGSSGAVAAVTRARNPILLAERVRTGSPHALIVGAGADALVDDPIDNASLLTPRSRRALDRWRERSSPRPAGSGTVGAVARDAQGRLAAATSTGGIVGKWPGRVGDTPLIGAGTYASRAAAVSCTGEGEAFIRAVTAARLASDLERGAPLDEAIREALAGVDRHGGRGGVIVLTGSGRLGVGWNAPHLAFGWHGPASDGARVGLEPGVRILE